LQDDTQRTAAAAPATPPPQPVQSAQPAPTAQPSAGSEGHDASAQPVPPATPAPAPAAPAPAAEPRGLEGLRAEGGGVEPRGFGSLGLAPDRTESLREAIRNDALHTNPLREPLPFHTDLDQSLPYGYDQQEPMYLPLALSVGAGFKFGCGFMLAVGVSLFGLFLAASVIFFVAALAGLPVPGASP
jgi:hypothetical protein